MIRKFKHWVLNDDQDLLLSYIWYEWHYDSGRKHLFSFQRCISKDKNDMMSGIFLQYFSSPLTFTKKKKHTYGKVSQKLCNGYMIFNVLLSTIQLCLTFFIIWKKNQGKDVLGKDFTENEGAHDFPLVKLACEICPYQANIFQKPQELPMRT